MPKTLYSCLLCKKDVLRWKSTVRNEAAVFCSPECKGEFQKGRQMGAENPNYKLGVHCAQSVCKCGGIKDYRAERCNRCVTRVEEYFKPNTDKRNNILKRYIKTYDLIPWNVCLECGQGDVWCGKPLVLQLDHIDGNPRNNVLSNLRYLCPSCHSQTPTYASKNKGVKHEY